MKRYPLVVFGVAASSDSPAPYSMREGRAQQAQAGVEIRQRVFAVMRGDSGCGKSFLVLDLAFHVATGRPWLARDVSQDAVIYVCAEGQAGIKQRVQGVEEGLRRRGPAPSTRP